MCMHAIGGVLRHAPALLAFAAPTSNSYRRLVPGFEAPVNLAYSQRNRSAAVRIPMYSNSPKAKRLEFRCPDPSANGYLMFSALLMAVLDGIEGPRSGIERAYLLFDAGEVEEGRRALLFALPGLEPSDATEVIQLAGLMGRLSPEGAELLATAGVRAHRGQPSEATRALMEGVDSIVPDDHPPVLAQAARIAQRGQLLSEAARIR